MGFTPTPFEFTREKTAHGIYLRNPFDLTQDPEILSFNFHIWLQRVAFLGIAAFWLYLFVQALTIKIWLFADGFGMVRLITGFLTLIIFNLDKSVKIWGGIGNFWQKFAALITIANTLAVIFRLGLADYRASPLLVTVLWLMILFSYYNRRVAKTFAERFPNQMLYTEAAADNYRKTAHYRVPVIILVCIILTWFFSYPVAWIAVLFGYTPVLGGKSQSYTWLVKTTLLAASPVTFTIIMLIALAGAITFSYYDVYQKAEHTAVKRGAFYTPTGLRTCVVGAGAIGGITGAYLTMAGEKIILYDTNAQHCETINQKGLDIQGKRGHLTVKVPAAASLPDLATIYRQIINPNASDKEILFDVIILAVKSAYTEPALRAILPNLHPESMVVSIQNSINDDAIAAVVGNKRAIHGITFWGASFLGPGKVEQTSIGHFVIGELGEQKDTPRIKKLQQLLGNFGVAEVSQKVIADAWNKLILNGIMNTYGLIFGERCQVLFNNPKVLPVVIATISEEVKIAKRVAGTLGIMKMVNMDDMSMDASATPDQIQEKGLILRIISSVSGRIKSSMLQDYERGLRSENQFLLGLFLKENQRHAQDTKASPVETPFITRAFEVAGQIDDKKWTPGLQNLEKFQDLLQQLPAAWRDDQNFSLNTFKKRAYVNFYMTAASLVVKNY